MTRSESSRARGRGRRLADEQDPAFYEGLGHAIKVIRTERKMERKELAAAAGISYAYLSDIETGRGRPSSAALVALAEALGLAPHELLRAGEERTPTEDALALTAEALHRRGPSRQRDSWFRGAPSSAPTPAAARAIPPAAALDAASGPVGVRAELDATLDELAEHDLEIVLAMARRLRG